jgi:glycerophosphoryl diester phosphodiesterase
MPPPVLVHGHRGARAVLPENTLPAFAYAISVGADFLEMDVAVTRDDVVVVSHDPKLKSPRVAIRQLTLGELPRRTAIPTLDQVLDLAASGPIQFNIEVKSFPKRPALAPPPERFAELVWQTVRRHNLEARVMVQSFDFRVLRAMRQLAPHRALVTRARVRAAHAAGIAVVPWTANRPAAWNRLLAAQVDGIITDDPAALIAYLKRQ